MPQTFDEVIADVFTVKNDTIPQTAWPKLTCGVANEVTFQDSNLKLGDQREVYFQNAGQLRANADIRFLTGAPTATEKLRILPNGNVGIGTTSPQAKLQVSGGAIMPAVGNSNQAGIQFPSNPGGGVGDEAFIRYFATVGEMTKLQIGIGNESNDSIGLVQAGAERLTINNGCVGIGTMTPEGTLDVRGDIRAGNSDIYFTKTDHNHTGVGNTAGFAAIENSANFDALMILGRAGTPQGRTVRLWDYLEVNGLMNVTGNVGIGTTSPQARLQVSGGAIMPAVGASNQAGIQFPSDPGGGGGDEAFIRYFATAGETTKLQIGAGNDADDSIGLVQWGAERLTITSGRVGIGTTTPMTTLHVEPSEVHSGGSGAGFSFSNRETAGLVQFPSSGERWVLYSTGGIARLWSGGDKLAVTSAGNVGIGDSNPAAKLAVHSNTGGNVPAGEFWHGHPNAFWGILSIVTPDLSSWPGGQRAAVAGVADIAGVHGVYARARAGTHALRVEGSAIFSGAKTGYVVDHFVNRVGDALEQGDVVVISKHESAIYSGTDNNIPLPEVDLTDQAYDKRVCGIVAQAVTEHDLPFVESEIAGVNKDLPHEHPLKTLAAPAGDQKQVPDQQMGIMVTLGAYAHCKVDADIAPIEVGDLLTTSPTKGHAQKAIDPSKATGAIIGKALGSLKTGKGKIPVMVMLQ
jgi:hypothetical protein